MSGENQVTNERAHDKLFSVALWDAFDDVVKRLVVGRHTLKDFTSFLKKLADVEEAYAKGMIGAFAAFKEHEESGTLGSAYLQVKQRIDGIGTQHRQFAEEIGRSIGVIEEFRARCLNVRNDLISRHKKIVQNLESDTAAHAKSKSRYLKACRDLQVAEVQEQASGADGFTDKQRVSFSKIAIKARKEQEDAEKLYRSLCDTLLQTQERYDEQTASILNEAEKLEQERGVFLRERFSLFHTHLESTSSNIQQALLMMTAVIETIDVDADLDAFVASVRPTTAEHPPKVQFEAFDEPVPTDVRKPAPKGKGKRTSASSKPTKSNVSGDTPAASVTGGALRVETKALYDFAGDQEGELPFNVDDVIYVTSKDPGGWWTGECHGKTGVFPTIYCALGEAEEGEGAVAHAQVHEQPAAAVVGDESAVAGKKCRVLYDYSDAESPDVLEIHADEIVTIVIEAEGWYTGENSAGQRGIFPANYVELI